MSRKTGFELPHGITFEKTRIADGVAYIFRHEELGNLGRLVVQDHDAAQCRITSEVVGDLQDPMTSKRREILEPITTQLTNLLRCAISGRGIRARS